MKALEAPFACRVPHLSLAVALSKWSVGLFHSNGSPKSRCNRNHSAILCSSMKVGRAPDFAPPVATFSLEQPNAASTAQQDTQALCCLLLHASALSRNCWLGSESNFLVNGHRAHLSTGQYEGSNLRFPAKTGIQNPHSANSSTRAKQSSGGRQRRRPALWTSHLASSCWLSVKSKPKNTKERSVA